MICVFPVYPNATCTHNRHQRAAESDRHVCPGRPINRRSPSRRSGGPPPGVHRIRLPRTRLRTGTRAHQPVRRARPVSSAGFPVDAAPLDLEPRRFRRVLRATMGGPDQRVEPPHESPGLRWIVAGNWRPQLDGTERKPGRATVVGQLIPSPARSKLTAVTSSLSSADDSKRPRRHTRGPRRGTDRRTAAELAGPGAPMSRAMTATSYSPVTVHRRLTPLRRPGPPGAYHPRPATYLPLLGMNTLPSASKLIGRRARRTPAAMAPRKSHPSATKGSRSTSPCARG